MTDTALLLPRPREGLLLLAPSLSDPYKLKFAKRTTEDPYTFVCMIHPFMHGKVLVD